MFTVGKSTDKALNQGKKIKNGFIPYPWDTLEIGQSFFVPIGKAKFSTLQPQASRIGKRLKKTFTVVDHGENGIEVARIA